MRKLLGNAMHLANASSVLAAALACVKRRVKDCDMDDVQAFWRQLAITLAALRAGVAASA